MARLFLFLFCLLGASLSVSAQLTVSAGNAQTICAGGEVRLGGSPTATGGQGRYTYSWIPAGSLNDASVANPRATPTNTTTYTVTVTDSLGATASSQVTLTVRPMPTANILANTPWVMYGGVRTFIMCETGVLSYSFNFNASGTAQPGATFRVDWGNGNSETFNGSTWTSTQEYPRGLTRARYTITNPGQPTCVLEYPFNIYIGETPLGGLSVTTNTTICTGQSISFQWNNYDSNPPGTLYRIDFGDGNSSTSEHPPAATVTHTYETSSCRNGQSQYSIIWTIENPCDLRDGQINQIRVSETPRAMFEIGSGRDTVCVNTVVTINDANIGMQAPQCSEPMHIWSITPNTYQLVGGSLGHDNGQPNAPGVWVSGSPSLGIRFLQPGIYTLTDRTGNICGFDEVERTICVEEAPVPAFTLSALAGCSPLTISTQNGTTAPNSCRTRYRWETSVESEACNNGANGSFTTGSSASSFEPGIILSGAGVHRVRMAAINSCGNFPVERTVSVGDIPQVSINTLPVICAGENLVPTAVISACNSPISNHAWSFGNGTPSTSTTAEPGTIAYSEAGSLPITLTVTSACGPATATATAVVTPLPMAPTVNGPVVVCLGQDIALRAEGPAGASFFWSGPNGFSSVLAAPTLNDASAVMTGTYRVSMRVNGCTGPSANVEVTVIDAPTLTLTPAQASVCRGDSITFTSTGTGTHTWRIAGNEVAQGNQFTFTPTAHTVITVSAGNGTCATTAQATVSIVEYPVADPGTAPTYCAQAVTEFMDPVTPGGRWSGHGISPEGAFTPSTPGEFEVLYTVTNAGICSTSTPLTITVVPPPDAPVISNDTLVCVGSAALTLEADPTGGTWSDNGVIDGVFTPRTVGSFTVTYTIGTGSCAVSSDLTITVAGPPVVDAGADLTLCFDADTLTLAGLPAGGSWSGNGITNGRFVASAVTIGAHTHTYTYADANGCSASDQRSLTVNPLPAVVAGPDLTLCDQAIPETLAGYSPAGGTWSGPHVTAAGVFTPNGEGSFNLGYRYVDANGCSATDTVTIVVAPPPVPTDAGADRAFCFNDAATQFTATPVGGSWSGTDVSATGLFTPNTVGVHTISYALGVGTCATLDRISVVVHALPTPVISGPIAACVDVPAFTLSATPVGGVWSGAGIMDAASGNFLPAVAAVGDVTITYTYTDANGCTDHTSRSATVHPLPVTAITHPGIACVGAPYTFTQSGSGATAWSWNFGDNSSGSGPTPTHSYNAAGERTVTLTSSSAFGCSSSASTTVTIWTGPRIGFSAGPETLGCGPLPIDFVNTSTGNGTSYTWDLGIGAPFVGETAPRTIYPAGLLADTLYWAVLTASNLCATVNDSIAITVRPSPTARFAPAVDTGCSPWPVVFSNTSVGQATAYHWAFGDGAFASTMDSLVQHLYTTGTADTTFTIRLIATNACGTDSVSRTVTVLPNTITTFFHTDRVTGCAPLTVNFSQFSQGVSNWRWEFGDGNGSMLADPTHVFAAGTWTVFLFGDNGCSYDTAQVTLEVTPAPVIDLSVAPDPVCLGAPITLRDLTPNVAQRDWQLGDGNTSSLVEFEHQYGAAGTYTISLTVTGPVNGCSASTQRTVRVAPLPSVAFAVEPTFCAPGFIAPVNNSTPLSALHTWSINGTPFAHTADPGSYGPASEGSHRITLLLVDPVSGCRDSVEHAVTGLPTPEAILHIDPVDPCLDPSPVQVRSSSTTSAGLRWLLNDSLVGTLPELGFTASGAGMHTITLVATLPGPCSDTTRTSFQLHQLPSAAFSADTACVGQRIPLTDHSTHTIRHWWYHNGVLAGSDPSEVAIIPSTIGTDTLALTVMSVDGCLDSTFRIVHTYPSPLAFIQAEPEGDCRTIRFTAAEVDLGTYAWYLPGSDVPFSTDRAPLYNYPPDQGRDMRVDLSVTNIHGCSSYAERQVWLPLCVFAPNTFTPNNDGVNDHFLPSVMPLGAWTAFRIHDRWGEVVHLSYPGTVGWDGSAGGKQAPQGVYIWTMERAPTDEDQKPLQGHVTLLR